MTPEAKQAIEQITRITGNDTETVRRICEYMGHEPDMIAHMAIARMYAELFADEFTDEHPARLNSRPRAFSRHRFSPAR